MKFLILILSLTSFSLFAEECKKQKETKSSVSVYLNCEKDADDCLKLNDLERKTVKLKESSKLILNVVTATLSKDDITMTLDKNSTCWFEKITGENSGKQLALVVKGTVLINPTIQGKISGAEIQVSTKEGSQAQNLELCKNIFEGCIIAQEKAAEPKKAANSLANMESIPNDKDYLELNKKYKDVMESIVWVTNKEKLEVYNDALKQVNLHNPLVFSEGKMKGKKWFFGYQAYDYKDKKFISKKGFIKIDDHGWMKRSELFPQSIVNYKKEQSPQMIGSYLLFQKCPKEFVEIINKASQTKTKEELPELLMMQEKAYRSYYVANCAINGDKGCENEVAEMKRNMIKKPVLSCLPNEITSSLALGLSALISEMRALEIILKRHYHFQLHSLWSEVHLLSLCLLQCF